MKQSSRIYVIALLAVFLTSPPLVFGADCISFVYTGNGSNGSYIHGVSYTPACPIGHVFQLQYPGIGNIVNSNSPGNLYVPLTSSGDPQAVSLRITSLGFGSSGSVAVNAGPF